MVVHLDLKHAFFHVEFFSALAAGGCYNQSLTFIYSWRVLDFVTELCFVTVFMRINLYF